MNIKELLVPFSLALLTTWSLHYFFGAKEVMQNDAQSGQRFEAPRKDELVMRKPLNLEIDFKDSKTMRRAIITDIETEHAHYEFTTDGATLKSLTCKRYSGGKTEQFHTIFPPNAIEREKSTFLVAFEHETPYYFDLKNKEEKEDCFILTYSVPLQNSASLIKRFTIFKKTYRIDLSISLNGAETLLLQPRIFFVSPLLPELSGEATQNSIKTQDTINGIVYYRNGIKVLPKNEQLIDAYWSKPTLFGTQDRYFVHAMVNDADNFTQRAYYKEVDMHYLISILEGQSLQNNETWTLSFYMGPKEDEAMNAVDKRLEETLNYGWFSFISKPLSKLLLSLLTAITHYIPGGYGVAILIFTLLFKLLLLPFTFHSTVRAEETMKKRAEFQKKLEHIQTKFKNDSQALADARVELVRKYGMFPGMGSGFLLLLVQLPFFWALSIILSNAIELYKAPFFWIPDLSATDPYYILPILVAIAIIVHSPAKETKERIASIIMGIFVAALFVTISAGLTLYMVGSTVLGALQGFFAKRMRTA